MIKIGNRTIGMGVPYTIAEAGINHNGSMDLAFKMIDVAKLAGVDAIKFQTFKAEEFIFDRSLTYTYISQGKKITESQFDMFKRYEFSTEEWREIKRYCDKIGLTFLSTPQNISDLNFLLELGIPAIKIGSDDFTNYPLVRAYSQKNLPLILSSGMADLDEVYKTLECVGALQGFPVILLVCTSLYPTDAEYANLLRIKHLQSLFPNIPIGFSDHTRGVTASIAAVGLGSVCFEKHFTLSHDLPGPDHWFSLNKEELALWSDSIREAHVMLGTGDVKPSHPELEMRKVCRRSIVAATNIAAGEFLDVQNISLKRPGTGLSSESWNLLIGKKATRNLLAGEMLQSGDFS